MIETAVIVATGQPEHRTSLLNDRSRAMQPVLGKPLIVRMMDQIYRAGIRRFVLIAGVNDGSVAQHLHKSWKADAKLELILQTPLDSLAGCVARASASIAQPFILASYNSIVHDQCLQVLLRQHAATPDALLATVARGHLGKSAPVWYITPEGIIIRKPTDSILLDYLVAGSSFQATITDHQKQLAQCVSLNDLVVDAVNQFHTPLQTVETAWIIKMTSDHDLWLLNQRLLQDSTDAHILSELPLSVRVIPPVRIDPQVVVGEHATIGPAVYLERGASVGYGAHVAHTVVLARGAVAANTTADHMLVTSRGNLIAR